MKGSLGSSCGEMLQKMILENQRLRQEIEMLRGHGVDKREVGLLQLCGGMKSSVSGKVAQSEKGTDVTPGVGGGMLSGSGQPVGAPIPYGGGSELTGGGQPEAGTLFGPSGQQRESVSLSATTTSGKVAVSDGPSYQCFQRGGWGEGEPWGTQAILGGGMLGCTSGDKTASVAPTAWGEGKKTIGGGQQEAGSLLSSVGGGREGRYYGYGQHHGAGQERQQHCGGPGAAEIAAMMHMVMGGGQARSW